jgi:tetratricopeptide (TPR) repeat protein
LLGGLILGLGLGADRPAAAQPGGPVTDDDVKAIAAAAEQAAVKGDPAALMALIDWDAVLETATADVDAPNTIRETFRKSARSSFDQEMSMAKEVISDVKQGGSFRLLRSRVRNKRKTALIRLAGLDSGLNYFEFVLARGPGGRVRATDVYVTGNGEWLTQICRRIYLRSAAYDQRGMLDRLLGTDKDLVESFPKLIEMRKLHNAGRDREAIALYDRLPATARDDKLFLLQRLKFTQALSSKGLDDALYAGTLDRLRTLFPDDPSVDVFSIDAYLLKKQFDQAIAALDRLDKSVGGDPYLNVLRASISAQAGRPEKAREFAQVAVTDLPDIVDGYFAVLTANLALKDYPGALKTLQRIDERFAIEFNDLTTVPEYAGFVKSPQFAEWQNYLRKKTPRDAGKKD